MVCVVRLRHVALMVSDLAAAEKYFNELFGMRVTERYSGLTLMTADPSSSHELALQELPKRQPAASGGALDHIAFGVNSIAEVASFADKLKADGIAFSLSRSGNRLYFKGFDGIGMEVCYDPAVGIEALVP
jgi:catechol 2,3-dioxygenase-like lactoylglutathione lyase family enzyme